MNSWLDFREWDAQQVEYQAIALLLIHMSEYRAVVWC